MDVNTDLPREGPTDGAGVSGVAAPLTIWRPLRQTAPMVIASPHSGCAYPAGFLAESRLDARALRKSEDSFVDELCGCAPDLGVPLIAARFPRAYCDVNREAWELDPAMFEDTLPDHVNTTSPRVAAGLGTIARVVASGEAIYRHKLRFAEAQARIAACWQPYHAALTGLMSETRQCFGACLLLDVHSMPTPFGHAAGAHGPDIVLGDAHGSACGRAIVTLIEQSFRGEGLVVRRNDPYAGGYVTRNYGRPRERLHVVQIEIAKPLYMDERTITRAEGFGALQDRLCRAFGLIAQGVPTLL
ncbi:N-formylglutamate amidohydrolase [Acidiphilium sp.]|uniref:N-formylglutamate amidohydrolase n=1 Tax=Acidiphilium sp. TaxID=527 RepID=UPI003CFEC000